jgi:hypothetical protein
MDTRASSIDGKHASIWRSDCGRAISCFEKIKVLNENIDELTQVAQDALEDGLLMGCSEAQLRQAFHAAIDRLVNPYSQVNSDRKEA